MGLEHTAADISGTGIPSIMAARGTQVDSKYQYDPEAEKGAEGGTINPVNRRVRNADVQKMIDNIHKDADGNLIIGTLDNKIYDKTGTVIK